MRAVQLSVLILALGVVEGCTTTRMVSLIPEGQEVARTDHGLSGVQSSKTNSVTVWLLDEDYRSVPGRFSPVVVRVDVANRSGRALAFSGANISASAEGRAVPVITAAEYRQELQRREQALLREVDLRRARTLAGEESLRQYADLYAPQTRRGINGELFNDTAWQQAESMASVKARLNEWAVEKRAAIRRQFAGMMDRAGFLLAPMMVESGKTAGGIVLLEPERLAPGQPVKLIVQVGGEKHEFLFAIKT